MKISANNKTAIADLFVNLMWDYGNIKQIAKNLKSIKQYH